MAICLLPKAFRMSIRDPTLIEILLRIELINF